MSFGIVADVKRGEMESKDLGEAHKGEDPLVCGEFGLGFVESLKGDLEISEIFPVVLVFFLGEFLAQEADEGLPRLLTVAEGDAGAGFTEKG